MQENHDEKSMSVEEKIDYIDREIRLLHKFCVDSGYSPRQIERYAEPFFSSMKSRKQKKLRNRLIGFAVVVAIFAALLYVDPAYRLLVVLGRQASIKILPFWDWTPIYDWECFIDNPLYTDSDFKEDDCKVCEDLKDVERIENTSVAEFGEYLKDSIPIIIQDGMADWPDTTYLSLEKLNEIYQTHPVLKQYASCNFTSSEPIRHDNQREYVKMAFEKKIQNHFAHWETCQAKPGKAFREYYQRPYFLGNMVQLSVSSWVFVSDSYNGTEFMPVPISEMMVMIMQMKGQMRVEIIPNSLCKDCQTIHIDVMQGEILVVTSVDSLYELKYLPDSPGENIAVAVAGSFD